MLRQEVMDLEGIDDEDDDGEDKIDDPSIVNEINPSIEESKKKKAKIEETPTPAKIEGKRGREMDDDTKEGKEEEEEEVIETKAKKSKKGPIAEAHDKLSLSAHCSIVGRETERKEIKKFLKNHIKKQAAGSMYLSGSPGTGKTALMKEIVEELKEDFKSLKMIFINCMEITQAKKIYRVIADQLKGFDYEVSTVKEELHDYFQSSRKSIIVVLDEIDQLLSGSKKDQSILYSLFEWTIEDSSKLVLIGIANALDLTERSLPHLQAKGCCPILIHFQRYDGPQILAILQDRLSAVSGLFDPKALEYVASKIGRHSGDLRKALQLCISALDKLTSKGSQSSQISFGFLAQLVNQALGDHSVTRMQGLLTQQKILLCAMSSLQKSHGKNATYGDLRDRYIATCKQLKMPQMTMSEFKDACDSLGDAGLVSVIKSKVEKLQKVELNVSPEDIAFALEDERFLKPLLDV